MKRFGSAGDAEEIKQHPWFKTIDWKLLLEKKLEPPFIPYMSSASDTRNFDKVFLHTIQCIQGYTETVIGKSSEKEGEKEAKSCESEEAWKGFDYSESDTSP